MADREEWGEAGVKYEIHDETFGYFRRLEELGSKSFDETTAEEQRAAYLRQNLLFAGNVDFTGSETHLIVPAEAGSEGGVPVSVYKPAETSNVPAIFVYFHGGGLVIGSRSGYATMLKLLAKRTGCIVVNVEYRLAPEHKAPAAFLDCRVATQWVLNNKVVIGGREESQVGVGGDSAGGQLAASISHDVKGLAFQILVYPHTDLTLSAPSFTEFATTPGLNMAAIDWFTGLYLVNDDQRKDPVVSPYHRPSFTGLPPALCILAELDPLRDDGLDYCQKMKDAGVQTEILLVKGATHVFFHLAAHHKELTKEPYDRCVQFIKRFQPV